MVDHQHHLAVHRPVARAEHVRRRSDSVRAPGHPPIHRRKMRRFATWQDLMPAAVSRAVRDTFVVHDPGSRLVQCLQADPPQAEAQIGILEIGRRVAFIETAQAGEHRPFDHQRGAGTVIHLAHVVVHGRGGILQPAEIPARGILPDDPAGFLQPPVRIQQFGPDSAGARPMPEQRHHRLQPAVQHLRVVVEEIADTARSPARRPCCNCAGIRGWFRCGSDGCRARAARAAASAPPQASSITITSIGSEGACAAMEARQRRVNGNCPYVGTITETTGSSENGTSRLAGSTVCDHPDGGGRPARRGAEPGAQPVAGVGMKLERGGPPQQQHSPAKLLRHPGGPAVE